MSSRIGQILQRLRIDERWMLMSFLIVAVAVPTIFFLFFLRRSLLSETELARSTTTTAFLTTLGQTQEALARYLADHEALQPLQSEADLSPGEKFTRAIRRDTVDSLILLDASGHPAFPIMPRARSAAHLTDADRQALELREELQASLNPHTKWTRLIAGMTDLVNARDTSGRLIVPGLQLQALLSATLEDEERTRLLTSLSTLLLDYRTSQIPSSQRLFLAHELRKVDPNFLLPVEESERLAVDLLQMSLPEFQPGVLTKPRTNQAGWLLPSRDKSRVAYFRHDRIARELAEIARQHLAGQGLDVKLDLTGSARPAEYITHASAGESLPGWELQIFRTADTENQAASQRTQRFIAIGAAVLALIGLVGFFSVRRYLSMSRTTDLRHDFLSTVSHELKTPLTSIRLLVETLSAGQWANPERTKQYTEVMQREITRLSHLVESFLTYTRLERGKLKFEFADTDPAQIVDHAVAIIGARFRGNCDFIVDVAPDLPLLNADSDTLITAVLNLLDNAHKYSPEHKRITLRVYSSENSVYFSVGDNGIGLSPADCRRVLQRYYRVDSEATRGIQGAGLGLSIVKNVAEAHHGELSVRSELGKGSCFTIRIPVQNPEKS
jgi:signal transduction histidine kinase